MYRVIYDAINEIEAAMKGMLAPKFQGGGPGPGRGAQCVPHHRRGHGGRLLCRWRARCSATPRCACCGTTSSSTTGAIASLQRFKDSVKEVAAGYECGITFEKFQDIKEGDIVEAFLMEQIEV